jgi:hypothetical protein
MPMKTPVIPLTNMPSADSTVLLRFCLFPPRRLLAPARSVSSRNGLTYSIAAVAARETQTENPVQQG